MIAPVLYQIPPSFWEQVAAKLVANMMCTGIVLLLLLGAVLINCLTK